MENIFLYCHLFLESSKGVIKTVKIPLDTIDTHIIELKEKINKIINKQKDSNSQMFKIISLNKTLISPSLCDTIKTSMFFENSDDIFCKVEMNITPIKTNSLINSDDVLKFKQLTTYSFWEANKQMVKVKVPLKGVETIPKENIKATFTENSLDVKVFNLNGLNYHFGVPRLDANIVPDRCEALADKDGSVVIKLRKAKEDDHWSFLFKQKYVGEN